MKNLLSLLLLCATVFASCAKEEGSVSTVTLSKTTLTLAVGDKESLTAIVLPADVGDETVTWSTSDAAVATVSASGEVSALKAGVANIIATSVAAKTMSATCVVTVFAPEVRTAGYVTKADDGTNLPAGMLCVGMFGDWDGTAYTKALYIDKRGTNTSGINQGDVDDGKKAFGYYGTVTGITNHYTGLANTNALTESAAANYCRGKGMYLPALRQLRDGVFAAKAANLLTDAYTFIVDSYWSSSDNSNNGAWYVFLGNGFEYRTSKDAENDVRCVREF